MPNAGNVSITPAAMLEYLQTHVHKDGDCLLWAGYMANGKYPAIGWRNKKWAAQRLLLTLLDRRVYPSYLVYTTCGNRGCMNVDHLRAAPRAQCYAKISRPMTGAARSLSVALGRAKTAKMPITERDTVLRMRMEGMTYKQIGEKYGVTRGAVGHALRAWARATGREA